LAERSLGLRREIMCRLKGELGTQRVTRSSSGEPVEVDDLLPSQVVSVASTPLADLRRADGGLLAGRPVEAVARPGHSSRQREVLLTTRKGLALLHVNMCPGVVRNRNDGD
jgi:hypothetical protein